nr:hypothetical protein [Tanacetum cinerariifolium]
MSKKARNTKGQASSSREETMEEKVRKFELFDYEDHQMNYDNLTRNSIHPRDVVDWEFLSNKGLAQSFFNSINTDTFFRQQWVNLFHINKPIFRELVCNFFASFEFDASPCRYEPLHKGVIFRLGGVESEMSLFELGWRVGLYSKRESKDVTTLSGLRRAETVNSTHVTHLFWPSIGDDRKETTNRVTEIDLFYLYCFFGEGVVCSIPYWLTKYLKVIRDKSVIFKGMFVAKIARSFGFLTKRNELNEGECCWPITRGVIEEDEDDDEDGDGEGGNKGAGRSMDIYQNMSAGDWQVRQARLID